MKNFNIFYYNHSLRGRRSILDYIEWLYFELKSYGYTVTISKKINLNSINILIDNFNYETANFLKENKIRFGVIATEILTDNTMNYYNSKLWTRRRENFDQVSKLGLFTLTQGENQNLKSYRGYQPFFMNYNKNISKKYHKEISKKNLFCFTGPITAFRKEVLNSISIQKKIEISEKFLNKRSYANLLLRSKYFLCIQQEQKWPTISMSKIMQGLHHNCIPVVLKMPKLISNQISKFVIEIDKNNLEEEINKLDNNYLVNLEKINQYKKFSSDYDLKSFLEKFLNSEQNLFTKENKFIKSEMLGNVFFPIAPFFLKRGSQLMLKKKEIVPLDDIRKYVIFINNLLLKKIIEFLILNLKKLLKTFLK